MDFSKKTPPVYIMHSWFSSGPTPSLVERLYHFLGVTVPGMVKYFTLDIGGKLEFITYPSWR